MGGLFIGRVLIGTFTVCDGLAGFIGEELVDLKYYKFHPIRLQLYGSGILYGLIVNLRAICVIIVIHALALTIML